MLLRKQKKKSIFVCSPKPMLSSRAWPDSSCKVQVMSVKLHLNLKAVGLIAREWSTKVPFHTWIFL